MKGVPASFEVTDELYYLNAEPGKVPAGTAAIEVLAQTSPSVRFKQHSPELSRTTSISRLTVESTRYLPQRRRSVHETHLDNQASALGR